MPPLLLVTLMSIVFVSNGIKVILDSVASESALCRSILLPNSNPFSPSSGQVLNGGMKRHFILTRGPASALCGAKASLREVGEGRRVAAVSCSSLGAILGRRGQAFPSPASSLPPAMPSAPPSLSPCPLKPAWAPTTTTYY